VVAVADGTVSRVRDGVPDQIAEAANDRLLLRDRECGNGIMIDHPGAISSQYCHLKNGSLVVRPGTQVRKGERIGSIGSSGLAEFPHVHLSVRRDGRLLDPLTGRSLENEPQSCGDLSASLLDKGAREALVQPTLAILDVGLAGTPPELSSLVRTGRPPPATGGSRSTVAWLWAINVDAGSRFRIRMVGPDDVTWMDHTTDPLPGRKANYLAYAGRKTPAKPGVYRLTVEISDGQKQLTSMVRSLTIAD
jgi:murein DD-endopeptidase MepM/ murein hydrolase activator NlpD